MFSRIKLKLRRDLVKKLGVLPANNYYLDNPVGKQRDDVQRLSVYSKAINFSRVSLTDKSAELTYSYPRRYVYRIPNAIIEPVSGLIYDQHGKLIAESSSWNITRLLCEIPRPYITPPKNRLRGDYIFCPSTPNYYHWLLEELPAFLGALDTEKSSNVLTGSRDFKPMKEFFQKSGLPIKKLVSPVQVDYLVMVGKTSGFGSPYGHNTVHPHDVKIVEERFKNIFSECYSQEIPKKKIYLSRTGLRRSPEGEHKLDVELKKLGFYIFDGKATLSEQVSLFSEASLVVGASGAAMTNIMWVPKSCKLLKLNLDSERFHFFNDLSLMRDMEFDSLDIAGREWSDDDVFKIVGWIKSHIS